jgi:cell division septation protein DedD
MAQARNDVEVQNQLGYLYQRCDLRADTGARAAATDTGRVDSTGRVPPGAQTPGAPSPGAPSPGTPSPAAPPIGAAPTPAPVPIQPPGAADAPPSAANPAPTAANAPSTAAPPPASPPAAVAPAARTIYRVQIAAVATRKGAEDAARKARPLGLSVITVEEKGLYKVRLGEYPTREAAQNAAASLKARLGGSPFVVAGP